jgi:hypothetical protein
MPVIVVVVPPITVIEPPMVGVYVIGNGVCTTELVWSRVVCPRVAIWNYTAMASVVTGSMLIIVGTSIFGYEQ